MADELYKKVQKIYINMNQYDITEYKNFFEHTLIWSEKIVKNYDTMKIDESLKAFDEGVLNIFSTLDKKYNCMTFDLFYRRFTLLKSKTFNMKIQETKSHIVLLEFIKLQKNYSLLPELLILEMIRPIKIANEDALLNLRALNLLIEYTLLKNKTGVIYKENVVSFVMGIYKRIVNDVKDVNFLQNQLVISSKCRKIHSRLLFIFIMNLTSHRKVALERLRNNEVQRKRKVKKTIMHERSFLATCYSLIHRHLLLNVMVHNQNYDLSPIEKFINEDFKVNECIECVLEECFNILKAPVAK